MSRHLYAILIVLSILFNTYSLSAQCDNPTIAFPDALIKIGIQHMSLNQLSNTTPLSQGYTREYDSIGVVVDTLVLCNSYKLALALEGTVPQLNSPHYAVWIDWNGDGDFNDEKEEIINRVYPRSQLFAWIVLPQFLDTLDVIPPANSITGNVRMRIMCGVLKIGSVVSTAPFTPCDSLKNGDVDYLVPPTVDLGKDQTICPGNDEASFL